MVEFPFLRLHDITLSIIIFYPLITSGVFGCTCVVALKMVVQYVVSLAIASYHQVLEDKQEQSEYSATIEYSVGPYWLTLGFLIW